VGTKVYQKVSLVLLDQLAGHPPDAGEGGSYPVYDGMSPDAPQMGGIPVDFIIEDKSHPIFKEYGERTVKIFWGGGPGLIPGEKARTILKYPDDIHNIQPLHVWEYIGTGRGYIGKWIGVVKSVMKELTGKDERRLVSKYLWRLCSGKISVDDFVYGIYEDAGEKADDIFDRLATGVYKAKDWRRLDRIFIVKRAGMAGMVEETYGDGRIILAGPHTEDAVWDDGRIIDVEDTRENCIWDGLMRWIDYGEKYYNKWILRREAAWVAGLDEDELPPIADHKEVIRRRERPHVEKRESFFEILVKFFRRIFRG